MNNFSVNVVFEKDLCFKKKREIKTGILSEGKGLQIFLQYILSKSCLNIYRAMHLINMFVPL